ncbi:MAG: 2-keto-4-pentenoate hydratase [Alphaproteobacteria bacterium]|jgi:2-keto-4-pentenoate hydratase
MPRMTPDAIEAAAAILSDLRWRTNGQTAPLDDLPEACRPQSLDEAYAVQDALRARLSAHGLGPQTGWKIGCTTAVMQAYLDIPHPCAGTLYQQGWYCGRATLNASDYFQLGLECEIAVRLAADLAPPRKHTVEHTVESVTDAVGDVMTSVEIVDHRFRDFTAAATESLIADDFFSVGCVTGAPSSLAALGDLSSLTGGFKINGAAAEITGQGDAILGHPLNALVWLANHLSTRGTTLQAGHIVTLGSVVKTIYPAPGDRIEASFDRLAPVYLTIN